MDILTLLAQGIEQNASDLHLSVGLPPLLRLDGQLQVLDLPILSNEQIEQWIFAMMTEQQQQCFLQHQELDFAFTSKLPARFRVNVFQQQRGIAAAFRFIPRKIPALATLNVSPALHKICDYKDGLVLITGPTGSGKTTTLAAILNQINQTCAQHIITIEDPIEFIYKPQKSLINQREIHVHTDNFNNALRAALREDPDIILIGELRDLETIRLALTAAETGHLVLASLHAISATKALNRIIDIFPTEEKAIVSTLLADILRMVVAQLLSPKIGGGRVMAQEILLCNDAVRNLIRENKSAQIYSLMQTNVKLGMCTMAENLAVLRQKKIIAEYK